MASEDVQTNLRLPADLKDRLMAAATRNNRSLSAEVASRLEASYATPNVNKVIETLFFISNELEKEKVKVDIERSVSYRLANSLKFLVETGDMPTHTDKTPEVKPLMELVDEVVKTRKDAFANAKDRINRQRERLDRLQREFESFSAREPDISTDNPKP